MSDIVSELRAWPARGDGSDGMSAHTVGGIMENAADEIERLRSALKNIADNDPDDISYSWGLTYARQFIDTAKAALAKARGEKAQ